MGWDPRTWFQGRNNNDDAYNSSEIKEWTSDRPTNESRVYENWDAYDRGDYQVKREGRINPGQFLGNYGEALAKQIESERKEERGGATTSAMQQGKKTAKDVARQFGKIGDDITIEPGYRDKGFTLPGTPGKKGFLGTAVKAGIGMAFPGAGGTIANAAIGDRLDYM